MTNNELDEILEAAGKIQSEWYAIDDGELNSHLNHSDIWQAIARNTDPREPLPTLPDKRERPVINQQTVYFEELTEKMGKFRPIATEEFTKTPHFNPDSQAEMYCDNMYRLFCSDQFDAFRGKTFYAYRIIIEKETINHRLGGPCQYLHNSLNGRLENLDFYYMGNEMPEIEYWENVASLDVGVIDNDFFKKYRGKSFRYKTEIAFDNFLIRYYLKTKSFSYFINGKKVNRSTFYKVTEQRISRIMV